MNKDKVKEMLERDVLLMGRVVSPATCVVATPEFHHEIAEQWHTHKKRVNIIAPRG